MSNFSPTLIRPTEKEISKVWHEAVFAFDASVLLRVFEINDKAREQFLRVLELLKDRIWIPHQAFQEYENRRKKLPGEQRDKCRQMLNDLEPIASFVEKYKHHSFVDLETINSNLGRTFEESKTIIEAARDQSDQLFRPDKIAQSVADLTRNKIGESYDETKLNAVHEEARERYRNRIPPGFKDAEGQKNKPEPEKFGDITLWFQLIDFAKKEGRSVVFVTDDQTDDWWAKADEQVVGPRFELTDEMASKTGVTFYMYTFQSFLDYAEKFLDTPTREASKAAEALQHQDDTLMSDIIVNGRFVYDRAGSNFSLNGQDNFSLRYVDNDDTFIHMPSNMRPNLHSSLKTGDTLNISASFSFNSIMYGFGRASYKDKETTYFTGFITLSGSIELPYDFTEDFNFKEIPFTVTGRVRARKPSDFESVLFEVTFKGSGEAEVSSDLEQDSSTKGYVRRKLTYFF